MHRWLTAPTFDDIEKTRQAALLYRLSGVMILLSGLGAGSGLLDRHNQLGVTLLFWTVVLSWLGVVAALVRRGRVVLGAWALSSFFWVLVAFATLFFGGMRGQIASVFAVCILLIGGVVGGRAALWMALLSSAFCAGVAYLETQGHLPPPLGPYSPINAWAAVTVTVLLTSVLLSTSIETLRRVNAEAERSAKERDEALRRSIQGQKMELVGNLTSGIAHDLNNLLTVIVSSVSVLRLRAPPDDRAARQLLDDLDSASSRAALMTSQLLAFGRARSVENVPVNFSAVLTDMGRMLPRLLGDSVAVEVNAAPGCWCLGTRVGLEQILLNLAVNARDAMSGGGTLTLELLVAGDRLLFHAKDTGTGMTEDARRRAFEPFFTTKATGTGLGLATVRKLADQFDATIEIESELGRGTTFSLSFPQISAPSASKPRTVSGLADDAGGGEASGVRGRILLVEDDALVRRTLARALAEQGYDVIAVADAGEALAFVAASRAVSCVVSDLSMPGMDGEALSRALSETHPALPMVMISGNRAAGAELIAARPRVFLPKPVANEVLFAAIRTLIQTSAGSYEPGA